MGSRDNDHPAPHNPPMLSSLIVRPSHSEGSGGGGDVSGGREPPPDYSRSDRYSDDLGYRTRARSLSPARRRNSERRYSSDFDHPPHGWEFRSHREAGRFRDHAPPNERGRAGGRSYSHGFAGPGLDPSPFRGEVTGRNNPNVRPREGDWYCPDPACNNLNFARREFCNNCNRPRSQRGAYAGRLPLYPSPRRFNGRLMDRSPPSYRSPPRQWAREEPGLRDFVPGAPPPPPHDYRPRRDRLSYLEGEYRGRDKYGRLVPQESGQRDRMRGSFFSGRKGYERQPLSPPLHPPPLPAGHDRRGHVMRERSRSPIDGSSKGYQRDLYMDRGRDGRSGGRDRISRTY
ncbi:hypothetical protein CDL15_Pgr012518 [Punica granatum]|uniref:RanBP2-type domain-containing protein n=1 Tax=Punica granatum TaxID=22663 RepID=A0A218XZC3_PUNGR|nr:hypothetical protein CDL15_Pgr012518 [Punica granatum]